MFLSLEFLQDKLTVHPVENGQVAVTITLPPEMVREYCFFLESLAGFFHAANRRSLAAMAQARATSQTLEHEAEKNLDAYRARLVSSFDLYISRGLDRKTAIKRIAADLRAEAHPWCSPDLIRPELIAGRVAAGRPAALVYTCEVESSPVSH